MPDESQCAAQVDDPKKETLDISQCHIRIGACDIVDQRLSPILASDPDSEDNKEKAGTVLHDLLKETRVRTGTLLKTDNVSFLFGAGASISAGGFSLATIPKQLERALLCTAVDEVADGDVPGWIDLFYKTTSALTQENLSFDERKQLLDGDAGAELHCISMNLEEYLSHLHTWTAGMTGLATSMNLAISDDVELEINKDELECLTKEITRNLSVLLNLPNSEGNEPLRSHRRFIKKVLTRPLNLRRANLFTLNYDTLLEQAADAEGAVLVDGFVGMLRRVSRPESYDLDFYFPAQTTEGRVHRFDRVSHLYKLHGSITWHRCDQAWENPHGLYATFFDQGCQDDEVLIYPSPLKYGQVLGLPYSELFRRFGNAIAQPQSVLFTIGYGFKDEHVNALIRQAMAIPSFTLVVVDPEPKNDFVRKMEELGDERVWFVTGWHLGTFEHFVEKLLPDLREEEITAKVMRTFKALLPPVQDSRFEEVDSNGE